MKNDKALFMLDILNSVAQSLHVSVANYTLARFSRSELLKRARVSGSLIRGKSLGEIRAHFADAMIAASAIEMNQTILTADGRSKRVFGDSAEYLVYR